MNPNSIEILLVEDNPNDVELTLLAFHRHRPNTRIQVARDGAEALDFLFDSDGADLRLRNAAPKLILLDLKLPKMNGDEVLRRLKEDPRTRPIPVVVLSSSSQDSDVAQAYRLGANSYLVKPVDFDHFTDMVKALGCSWLDFNHGAFRPT